SSVNSRYCPDLDYLRNSIAIRYTLIEQDRVQHDVQGYSYDVSNEESAKVAMQEVVDRWSTIDVLVASADIVENYPAIEYPTSRILELFDINFHGAFFSAREACHIL
ncbi:hypothetical protein FRB95_004752, partial [Tulasnella sp. JGI-2019a]